MNLDTATDILEWAEYGRTVSVTIGTGGQIHRPDTATAERLALAMRVLAIVESGSMGDTDGAWSMDCRAVLGEAAKGESK